MREKLVINKLNLPPKCIDLSLKQFRAHYHKRFYNFVTVDIHLEGALKICWLKKTLSPEPEVIVRRCSVKKVFLEISQNSQENTCAGDYFFNKVAGLRLATLLKKRLWHKCFLMNFAKFLRTPFVTEHLWWLLLYGNLSC